jgi:5-methylthioadenosine/S-adenosylhomocysteine deaminase
MNFEDQGEERLRFREDHFINKDGSIAKVRSRLTLIGATREHSFPHEVMLSRSRFIAPADQSLRFYREYFKPQSETEVEKDRLRYLVEYKGEEFFINLDEIKKPKLGLFLEVKARTWSETDAEEKSALIADLIALLGATTEKKIIKDYIQIVEEK